MPTFKRLLSTDEHYLHYKDSLISLFPSAIKDTPFNVEDDPLYWNHVIDQYVRTSFVAISLDENQNVIGFIFGCVAPPHPLSRSLRIACEHFWWVKPTYRNGQVAIELLYLFEQWAEAQPDVTHIACTSMSNRYEKALDRLYTKRLGYTKIETGYLMEIK